MVADSNTPPSREHLTATTSMYEDIGDDVLAEEA
jgi:hypothetical protein